MKLYDSVSKEKKEFIPLDKDNVRMYFCGPTVYDYIHIGNLRAFITADILKRILSTLYPKVTFVRNITDIDDKIRIRAIQNNESISDLTERTIKLFHEDVDSMGLTHPDVEPKATDHIQEMIDIAQDLIEKGHAYIANDTVYFDTSSYHDHGKLSGREHMEGNTTLDSDETSGKKNIEDFVIWKPAKDDVGWDTPWGKMLPGWHTECTVMSRKYLGDKFDIHGGGQDLMFPHHENENAQAVCSGNHNHDMMANYWIHNSMLLIDGKKMSKSEGNFFTIRDVLSKVHPETLKLFLLSANYRSPLNFTWEGLDLFKKHLDRFYRAIESRGEEVELDERAKGYLYDDMDTAGLLSYMHELANSAFNGDTQSASQLFSIGIFLGIFLEKNWFKSGVDNLEIESRIKDRAEFKKKKMWKEADEIRSQLSEMGIILEDSASGTTWRKK